IESRQGVQGIPRRAGDRRCDGALIADQSVHQRALADIWRAREHDAERCCQVPTDVHAARQSFKLLQGAFDVAGFDLLVDFSNSRLKGSLKLVEENAGRARCKSMSESNLDSCLEGSGLSETQPILPANFDGPALPQQVYDPADQGDATVAVQLHA